MWTFFTLVSIENTKLWKRLSTKVMLIIMIVIVTAATGGYKFYNVSNNIPGIAVVSESWQQDLQQELNVEKPKLQAMENSTDKTVRLLIGVTKKTIAENEYRINNNIRPESNKSVWTRVTDFSAKIDLYDKIIALFVIIACAATVAGEFSEGTIKMMISRPYKRQEIITAKLAATIIYGLSLSVTTFVLNFIFMGIYFGFNGMYAKEMLWTSSTILYVPAVLKTLIVFGLDFLEIIVYVLLTFAISAIFRSRSIATGGSLFLLLVGGGIVQMLSIYFDWCKYLPFGVSDFANFVNVGALIDGTTLSFALIVSGIYSSIFCFAGYLAFIKKDI